MPQSDRSRYSLTFPRLVMINFCEVRSTWCDIHVSLFNKMVSVPENSQQSPNFVLIFSISKQKLQLFQGQMEEIDVRLVEAEQVKSNWTPVQDLVIDSLSEQMDELKVMIIVECFETDCDLLTVRSVFQMLFVNVVLYKRFPKSIVEKLYFAIGFLKLNRHLSR